MLYPLKNPLINLFIHWEKFSRIKCFSWFRGFYFNLKNKIPWQPATAKTYPGNLLCYFEPASLLDGLVCFFVTHFWKVFVKNQKPRKSTRALFIECYCLKKMWKNKTFNKNLSWNNNFQIMRESLQLICQFFNWFVWSSINK